MRVHTVASLAVAGMGLTSFSVWQLTPAESATEVVVPETNAPPAAAPAVEDSAHFVTGATLQLEGRVGHATIEANREQSTFLLATVTGAASAQATSSPLDLTIVIDQSGSMAGDRMRNAIEGARGMIRRLRDGDRVTVITYSDGARVHQPATIIDSASRELVAGSLSRIRPDGETCISCGLNLALSQSTSSADRVSRILLLSDGEATVGVRNVAGFQLIAERARMIGTTVTTIGVDTEYNERVMAALAQFSNGAHYFVETPMNLPPVFDRELESLTRTVANDVELVVDLAEGVRVERIFDRTAREEGRRLIVPLGTVAPGEEKTMLLGIRVPAGTAPDRAVALVQLRYVDLTTRERSTCQGSLAVLTTTDPSQASRLDAFVEARISRTETAEALREANELSAMGRIEEARERLDSQALQIRHRARRAGPGRVNADFSRQASALEHGSGGFARPAAAPSAIRSNAALANPFAQ